MLPPGYIKIANQIRFQMTTLATNLRITLNLVKLDLRFKQNSDVLCLTS